MKCVSPSNGRVTRAVAITVLSLLGGNLGCDKAPAAPSSPGAANGRPSVTSIAPPGGFSGDGGRVVVIGSGFVAGANLTLGGATAKVISATGTTITAFTPVHGAGTVDVVVTNPDGQNGSLTGGYTYQAVTLTASANRITPGGELKVDWAAPGGRPKLDWIGLFRIGDASTTYENGWWQYTNGAASGTLALNAPTAPGEYEFRYLLDDGFSDVARSSPVIISAPVSRSVGK